MGQKRIEQVEKEKMPVQSNALDLSSNTFEVKQVSQKQNNLTRDL
jgi:hypothetical protein